MGEWRDVAWFQLRLRDDDVPAHPPLPVREFVSDDEAVALFAECARAQSSVAGE